MDIQVIAFDADDTLWKNEPFFKETEQEFAGLLKAYASPDTVSTELFQTEMANLERYGYGAKSFTLSMIETALRITSNQLPATAVTHIIGLGKSLLDIPIVLLEGVEETLRSLSGKYKLVLATKGDLVDQQRKLQRSGLSGYFQQIEILPHKTEKEYRRIVSSLQIHPDKFMMVGDSLKSDIWPVLDMGGYAVHIPAEIFWKHEKADGYNPHPHLQVCHSLNELPRLVNALSCGSIS